MTNAGTSSLHVHYGGIQDLWRCTCHVTVCVLCSNKGDNLTELSQQIRTVAR